MEKATGWLWAEEIVEARIRRKNENENKRKNSKILRINNKKSKRSSNLKNNMNKTKIASGGRWQDKFASDKTQDMVTGPREDAS